MKMKWKRITFVLALAMTFAMGGMTGKAMAADLVVNEQNFPSEWLRNLMKTPLYDVNGDGDSEYYLSYECVLQAERKRYAGGITIIQRLFVLRSDHIRQ